MYLAASRFRDLISIIVSICFLLNPLAANALNSNSKKVVKCSFSLEASRDIDFSSIEKPHNIFSESLKSTIANSAIWLLSVQGLKYSLMKEQGAEFMTTAFLITLPLDVSLTIMSHWISLGKLPWLKNFAEGKLLGPRYQFWSRIAANVVIGSSAIIGSWAVANQFGANINIGTETISAAIVLCMLVYSSMQVTKPFLFQSIPNLSIQNDQKKVEKILGKLAPALKRQFQDRAQEQEINPKDAEALFLQMLELVILMKPWEAKARLSTMSLNNSKILDLISQIEFAKAESPSKVLELRRHLIAELLKEADSNKYNESELRQTLKLRDLDLSSSVHLLKKMGRFHSKRKFLIFGASMLDQALAVGFAGGVLLYSTTHWAATGELPLFLTELLGR